MSLSSLLGSSLLRVLRLLRRAREPEENSLQTAAKFYEACVTAVVFGKSGWMHKLRLPRELNQNIIENDPHFEALCTIKNLISGEGVSKLSDLSPSSVMRVAMYAKSVGPDDAAFVRWYRTLSPAHKLPAMELRLRWQGMEAERIRAEAAMFHQMDERQANEELYHKQSRAALPPGGLAEWVQNQNPAMWHEICINVSIEAFATNADVIRAIEWIINERICGTSTAMGFLAKAHATRKSYMNYPAVDRSISEQVVKQLHSNLINGFYQPSRTVLPITWESVFEELCSPEHAGDLLVGRDLIPETGKLRHKPSFGFVESFPVVQYETWLTTRAERDRPGDTQTPSIPGEDMNNS